MRLFQGPMGVALGMAAMGGQQYYQKIKALFGSALIGYWPIWEASGTVAEDVSGSSRNGTHSGVTLAQTGIGDGKTAGAYGGTNSLTDIYSASLAGAFNGASGTIMGWGKVSAATWADATYRCIMQLKVNDSNRCYIMRTGAALEVVYEGGGTLKYLAPVIHGTPAGWIHYALTWNKAADRAYLYINGAQFDIPMTGIGTWSGDLASSASVIGDGSTSHSEPWKGDIAHCLVLNREATPNEISLSVSPYFTGISGNNLPSLAGVTAAQAATACVTPDPDAAGQAMHPSVIDFGAGGWNGYRYWMAETPLTNGAEAKENPCILVSSDGDTWSVPTGGSNPIVAAPGGSSYNSDPNITYYGGKLYLLNRVSDGATLNDIYILESSDGITWSAPVKIIEAGDALAILSPCVIFDGYKWCMWCFNSTSGRLERRAAPSIYGPWTDPVKCFIAQTPATSLWHLSVLRLTNGNYLLVKTNADTDLWLGTSADGFSWTFAPAALMTRAGAGWDKDQFYTASLVQTADKDFTMWYSGKSGTAWHVGKTTFSLP